MANLYANENFPLPAVEELRRLGHDVSTTQETGQAGQAMSDEAVLAHANSTGRMLLTFNRRHFVRLHLQGAPHCGMVLCTVDADFMRLARQVHGALQTAMSGERVLVRVNRPPM
jgi:hypothetical protein